MADIHMINDNPSTEDLLNFDRYVVPILQIITNPKSQTPFTISIFGSWGSGKSTLINYIYDKLKEKRNNLEFFRIKFNPWIYSKEENLLVPLLHTIQDSLDEDPKNRFTESVKKIGSVLTRLGATLLLKTVSANQITLEDIEKQEQMYMNQHQRAKSIIRNLRKELQNIIDEITDSGKAGRVVLFIDDLDRCEPDQIIQLLESIKLFLDLTNCFFILALDEDIVHRGVQLKYADFKFEEDRKNRIGREYLDKMIQLPLYLYPLSENQVEDYIKKLSIPQPVMEHAKLFSEIMMPNPRKIRRILNLFLLNLLILQNPQQHYNKRDDLGNPRD